MGGGESTERPTSDDSVDAVFLGGYQTKAGLPKDGLDRKQIDEIILEASKGSRFYEYQQRRERRIAEKVLTLKGKKEQFEKNTDLVKQALLEAKIWMKEAESGRVLNRTFIHIDMDAFFAAVETLKRPELALVPMAIGGESMLSTANYPARLFGVVSAMPGYIARKLCPHLIILPHDISSCKKVSEQVQSILREYDPTFSSYSMDEASLDVTDYLNDNGGTPSMIADELRDKIFQTTKLTCSAGAASNRQLAKLCSDINKPNGQFCLPPDKDIMLKFISEQKAKKINGVGRVTAKILEDLLGIQSCADIIKNAHWIRLLFSETQADFLLLSAMGLGSTFGETTMGDSEGPKSMSVERTFRTITTLSAMKDILQQLCHNLAEDLASNELTGRTITIKMKTSHFDVQTRAITLDHYINTSQELYKYSSQLLTKFQPTDLRLLGIRLSLLSNLQDSESSRYRPLDDFFFMDTNCNPPIVAERPKCPICSLEINSHPEDTLRINEHIDGCLKSCQDNVPFENSCPPPLLTRGKRPRVTLDAFFKNNKSA